MIEVKRLIGNTFVVQINQDSGDEAFWNDPEVSIERILLDRLKLLDDGGETLSGYIPF